MAPLLLLLTVYLAFVGLGLPDGVFGVAWPALRAELRVPLEVGGAVALVGGVCSVASSVASGWLLHHVGTARVVVVSFALTGGALVGIALVPSTPVLLCLMVPLGCGAGAVDTALNHFVAHHYSSRQMSWLHCAWGLGATLGPASLSWCLASSAGWRSGYGLLAAAQLGLLAFLTATRGLFPREASAEVSAAPGQVLVLGAGLAPWLGVGAFAAYTGAEAAVGLWAASLLVESRGASLSAAGMSVAVYYGAITGGRFVSGLVADRAGNRAMVRLGLAVAAAGAILLAWPAAPAAGLAGLGLLGAGFAPVYPCLMHETPRRFGAEFARTVIGMQVGAAYVGGPVLPLLLGLVAASYGLEILPAAVLALIAAVAAATELQHRVAAARSSPRQ